MGSFSDFLENELLDHIFLVGAYTAPTKCYIALCKSSIEEDDTGGSMPTEASGGAYARKSIATWDTAAAGSTLNSQAITFVQATADWGTVTDFGILDHLTAGNLLAYGKLTTSKSVDSGDIPKFATGDLKISLT